MKTVYLKNLWQSITQNTCAVNKNMKLQISDLA